MTGTPQPQPPPAGFWRTVRLLLKAARVRAAGRHERQRRVLQNQGADNGKPLLVVLATLAMLFFATLIHGAAVYLVYQTVLEGQRFDAVAHGKVLVSEGLLRQIRDWEAGGDTSEESLRFAVAQEARRNVREHGGREQDVEERLWREIKTNRSARFITQSGFATALPLYGWTGLSSMLGSLALLSWLVMMVCQGEGIEMDLQRRRHPMWEWLLSHPVPPGAVFLAEMLAPLSANPLYWAGPVFVGALYWFVYDDLPLALLAAAVGGVPVVIGAASLGKALEIGVMIRFPPRSRGAILGILSWLGQSMLFLAFISNYVLPRLLTAAGHLLSIPASYPWPWLSLLLGGASGGGYSFWRGMAVCWTIGIVMTAAGVWFSLWGAREGLSGASRSGSAVGRRRGIGSNTVLAARQPLLRKEFLWFVRDRSAVVQAILIPITAAGFQMFNFRSMLELAQGEWNYLCGAAICFGTYFLWVLGPKSLTSEGPALWIPLGWPQGLEALLKAKARLWAFVATLIVAVVMAYAALLFPADIWKIALVLIGWVLFARSTAEKSVTLVTAASSSGEVEKIPIGRRMATQMGMFTFCIGVITQQWHLAIVGIVFSYLTAAAMWQNFRARLPYLFDPWSEKLPPPPTLMHAMVAISVMLEVASMVAVLITAFAGGKHIGTAILFGYAIASVGVCLVTMGFLNGRGVPPGHVWNWLAEGPRQEWRRLAPWLGAATLAGAALAVMAQGYIFLLRQLPWVQDAIRQAEEKAEWQPEYRLAYGVLAVCFAPWAEEYLFRGLLFRALDREWGGWSAVLGSASFFTIYHPPLAWIPVFAVGAVNAILFKKSGALLPAVVLHTVYNLVVTLWPS